MLVAVTTNPETGMATASHAAALSRPWALCLALVRTRTPPTLDPEKPGNTESASACIPQPNCTMVMLVESDVRGGIGGILP
jgi:hypothetical protein